MKKRIDIIVPCFNEQECINQLYAEVDEVFESIDEADFTFLFIDDGSKDNTLKEIKMLAEEKGRGKIRYISFARNFGKESAIYAGFENCEGDYIVLMDADTNNKINNQNPSKYIKNFGKKNSKLPTALKSHYIKKKGFGIENDDFYEFLNARSYEMFMALKELIVIDKRHDTIVEDYPFE